MKESGKQRFALKKAYEISYAVFRVGSRISNAALREHLERQALSLLDAATVENYAWVSTVSRALGYLIKFGSDVGLINEANAETIMAQLQEMDASIAGSEKPAIGVEAVPLDDIFTGHEPLFPAKSKKIPQPVIAQVAVSTGELPEEQIDAANPIRSEIRQSAILEKIRQSGNCRIKDLQDILPDCSERTIRYDLQTLIEQNLVERVGSGGPAVFYRIRQVA
jgi:hypothetical protein